MLAEAIEVASNINNKHDLGIPEEAIIAYCQELSKAIIRERGEK